MFPGNQLPTNCIVDSKDFHNKSTDGRSGRWEFSEFDVIISTEGRAAWWEFSEPLIVKSTDGRSGRREFIEFVTKIPQTAVPAGENLVRLQLYGHCGPAGEFIEFKVRKSRYKNRWLCIIQRLLVRPVSLYC
jgi:hypothetical protein